MVCYSGFLLTAYRPKFVSSSLTAQQPEIRRIRRHRHIPKVVKKAGEIKREELSAIKRREENERKHTKKQFENRQSERDKAVLAREK